VATSSSVQIVPPSDKWFQGVTFSPDGNYIYYVAVERNNPAGILYQMPVLGGVAKKLIEDLATPVTISPDGKQAAFIRSDMAKAEDSLIIASLDGARERKLVTRKPPNYFVTDEGAPAWSPDGTSIVYAGYISGSGTAYEINVFEVDVTDGAEKALPSTQKWDWIDAIAWLRDGSAFLLTASELGSQGSQIWELSKSGQAHRITNDLGNYSGIDLTADSNTMVTSQRGRTSNIWIAPGGDSSRARQITSGTSDYSNLDWTPDGKLVFVARAQSSREIWVMDADGSGQKQVTSGLWNGNCSVCAGGHIVFSSSGEDGQRIWRMDMDGSNQKPLTMGKTDYSPTCSPDGKWKASTASTSLDAGPGNEFQKARVSCIAGPCPFTQVESDGSDSPSQKITATARNWSDPATFLVEAEVVHTMQSPIEHRSYPVVFGSALSFTLPTDSEGVSMEADVAGETIIFPLGPELLLSWANCISRVNPDNTSVYRCELKPGYRFQ